MMKIIQRIASISIQVREKLGEIDIILQDLSIICQIFWSWKDMSYIVHHLITMGKLTNCMTPPPQPHPFQN